MISFNNTYEKLPERFYQKVKPEKFEKPQLISFNHDLARELKMNVGELSNEELALIFSGQRILDSPEPLAMAYAGMQFGHLVPQLGDGRAHLLGEISGYDIQLKGSGRTAFSRGGDGRSALGPVLREYLVSEAMHSLGVPTTRALCAVTTGEEVHRQSGPEPGGIFTRVAASHLRVGTFQYFAIRNDLEAIKILLDYTIDRHYPELKSLHDDKSKVLKLLESLIDKQSNLVAHWSSLGFIHGVMNTDNFSVAGITIDYGPCAFMDEFEFQKVFSSIDKRDRYSFYNQVPIAQWNIMRFIECLLPFINKDHDKAVETVQSIVVPLLDSFEEKRERAFARKLGITDYKSTDSELIKMFLTYLEKNNLDFTLSFRQLPKLYNGDDSGYVPSPELNEFVNIWKARVKNKDKLDLVNPIYIPRNHQMQRVIDEAYEGNFKLFHKALEVFTNPFEEKENLKEWSLPPKENERVTETFCGT